MFIIKVSGHCAFHILSSTALFRRIYFCVPNLTICCNNLEMLSLLILNCRLFTYFNTFSSCFVLPIVSDSERPEISGSIRSIKMYSYAQSTVQERLVCSGDVPCLAQEEQGSGPLHPDYLTPSLSAWDSGDSVYWQPSRRMDLDSEVEIRSQPNTNPVLLDNVCNIILTSYRKLF
jgi:hypothetical protein